VALLLSAFAGFALVLAAIGLYSVVSYSVARRVKEFGIRAALGASGFDIVHSAVQSPLVAIAGGVITGLVLSLASDTIVDRWSIGNLSDPWVLGLTSLLLILITILAASLPARRAASIAPVVALRTD
jgi:putative ABC transport system permease protein